MSSTAISCPKCQAALRSAAPLDPKRVVRCPDCGAHFSAANAPALAPHPPFQVGVPLLVAAVAGALVLGGGIVGGALYLALDRPRPTAEVEDKAPNRDADQAVADQLEKLRQEREQLEKEKKRQAELNRHKKDGAAALEKAQYAEAKKAYTAALKLSPDDEGALQGLVAADTGLTAGAEEAKRLADAKKLLDQGRRALKAKQYAAAVQALQAAQAKAPDDGDVHKALGEAQAAAEADAAEKKKLADYRKFLDAGQAALDAGRYADAVREFLAAQRLVPDDADAVNGQKEAEKRLAALDDKKKREDAFAALTARARQALDAKRFGEAVGAFEAALRLVPGDRDLARDVADAKKAQRKAKLEAAALLNKANEAMRLNQFEDALALYKEAAEVYPEDGTAARGAAAARRAADTLAGGRAAAVRNLADATALGAALRFNDGVIMGCLPPGPNPADLFPWRVRRDFEADAFARIKFDRLLKTGAVALSNRLYDDAIRNFNEALKLVPNEPRAEAGLSQARYHKALLDGQRAFLARRRADAIKAYESALEEKPGDPTATAFLRQARAMR